MKILILLAIILFSWATSFTVLLLNLKNKRIFNRRVSINKFLKYSTPLTITLSIYLLFKLELYQIFLIPVVKNISSNLLVELISTTLLFIFLFIIFFLHSTLPKAIYQKKYFGMSSSVIKFSLINLFILIGLYLINIVLILFEALVNRLPFSENINFSILLLGFFILIFLYMNYYPSLLNIFYGKVKEENYNSDDIKNIVENLSKKSNIKIKRVSIVKGEELKIANAWTYGLFRKSITVTDYLIKNVELEEFETVIAHEIGHAKKNHLWINLLVMLCFIPIINLVLYLADKYTGNFEVSFFSYVVLFGLYYFVIIRKVSRTLEYKADKYIVKVASQPEAFIPAITKVSMLNSAKTEFNKLQELFMTHPPLEKRVQAFKIALEERTN